MSTGQASGVGHRPGGYRSWGSYVGWAADGRRRSSSSGPSTSSAASPWTRPTRPLRAPGHRDGARPPRPRPLDADPALRRRRPRVARPRPVRAVGRPRVDPPVLDAPPHRVSTSRSTTSRTSASGAAARRATPSAATPPGVEVTTGPARPGHRATPWAWRIAERSLRARFGADVVDHRTYCIAGDGDLSEGLSHEAASLAGHLGLGRLVCVYDDNHVSIDGPTELALTTTPPAASAPTAGTSRTSARRPRTSTRSRRRSRRAADDGGPPVAARSCAATSPSRRPTKTDDPEAHGYALKDDDIRAAKEVMGLPAGRDLLRARRRPRALPGGRRPGRRAPRGLGQAARRLRRRPRRARRLPRRPRRCPAGTTPSRPGSRASQVATRKASGACLQALADVVPALVAGGADLTGNTGTVLKGHGVQSRDEPGGPPDLLRHPRARRWPPR